MRHGLRSDASLVEATDAIFYFAEPLLGHPFQECLSRQTGTPLAEALKPLPSFVAQARRDAQRGALLWASSAAASHSEAHVARCERRALEGFLLMADRQARVSAWLARSAPTAEIREPFDRASETFGLVADRLRTILRQLDDQHAEEEPSWSAPEVGCAQEESRDLDLRTQIGAVVTGLRAHGKKPQRIVLSPTAFRHLRDQGCLRVGDDSLFGVPAAVDLGWPTSSFAVETEELAPLRTLRDLAAEEQGSTG